MLGVNFRHAERAVPDRQAGADCGALVEQDNQVSATSRITVDDRDRGGSGEGSLDRDCPCDASRTEHDQRRAGGTHDRAQRGEEALSIGVLA
jgi:hypothetical protein